MLTDSQIQELCLRMNIPLAPKKGIAFKDEINWYRINVKPEMLCDFMEIYCGYANSNYANIIEFDGIKYCLVGEYELIDNQLENGDGIVCINEEGKFDFYEDDRFMNEIINGDNEKLDRLEKFIQNN